MKRYLVYLYDIFKKKYKSGILLIILQVGITILSIITPILLQRTVDEGIVIKNVDKIIFYTILSASCLIFINTAKFFFTKLATRLKTEQSFLLKKKIMHNLTNGALSFFQKNTSGDILKTLESDIAVLENINIDWVISTVIEIIGGLFALRLLFGIDPFLLAIVIIAEIVIIIIQKKIVSILSKNARELRKLSGASMGIMEEFVSNIVSAIYCKSTEYQIKKYSENESTFVRKLNVQYNIAEANQLISNTIDGLLTISIYFLGGIWVIKGKMSYGELIAFSQYISLIISPVLVIINSFSKIELAIVSLDHVNHLVNMPIFKSGELETNEDILPSIRFDDTSICYDGNKPILQKLDMEFSAGNIYAIVGKNGSGKSTIIKTLYRLVEATNGNIYINNRDIKEWNIDKLRKYIGIVPQHSLILNDTIYSNIVLGMNISDDELSKVISIVDLDDTISELHNGLDSIVGEKGDNLSGGQKQKIAIARMLLSSSKILIFDEATSAIDNKSQEKIIEQIYKNYHDRLIIVIAHRISSIGNVDYVYYLENNTILEQGTLQELKQKKGSTYDLLLNE